MPDFGPLFDRPPADEDPPDEPSLDSLSTAREQYWSSLPAGGICPCCDRYGKSYRRKLNSGMALALLWIVFRAERDKGDGSEYPWVDVPAKAPRNVLAKARDFTILRYWGLLERQTVKGNDRERKKHPGLWRPTHQGVMFAKGQLSVPSHVVVYNDSPGPLEGDPVTIEDLMDDDFHYGELMKAWGA